MKKISKKEIQETVQHAMDQVLKKLDIKDTSKKTKKAINKVFKTIKSDVEKQTKQALKKVKALKKTQPSKKSKADKKPVIEKKKTATS